MKVKFLGPLTGVTRQGEIEIDASDVSDLLCKLSVIFGKEFENKVVKDGEQSDMMLVLVNGRNIRNLRGLQTQLQEDDLVTIVALTAGG